MNDRIFVCIEPVLNPTTLNYMYESISNEMMLVYEKGYKKDGLNGFRLKFSSNKPSGKLTFSVVLTYLNYDE